MDHDDTEPDIQTHFGNKLKAARMEAGLTQQQVAARAGIAADFLVEIESGTGDPDLRVVDALAEAVGCGAFELLKT